MGHDNSAFAHHRKQYADVSAAVARIPPILTSATEQLGGIRAELHRLSDDARRRGWAFDPAGTVVTPGPPPAPMAGLEPDARLLQDAMAAQLERARRADAEAAYSLRSLRPEKAGFAGPHQATVAAAATAIPPRGTAPADVKRWWDGLLASRGFWLRDIPSARNTDVINTLVQWWKDHNFVILTDDRPGRNYVWAENKADGFRMAVQESAQGGLSLGATSPCVWPNGTPAPKPGEAG